VPEVNGRADSPLAAANFGLLPARKGLRALPYFYKMKTPAGRAGSLRAGMLTADSEWMLKSSAALRGNFCTQKCAKKIASAPEFRRLDGGQRDTYTMHLFFKRERFLQEQKYGQK